MTIDMKSLAREGAKARLWQLETETNQLLQAFPDLRDGDRTRATSPDGTGRRRQMTAAERRSVSVRMKRYWAERRQKNGATKRPQSSEGFWQAQRHLRGGPSGDCCRAEETLGQAAERGQNQRWGCRQRIVAGGQVLSMNSTQLRWGRVLVGGFLAELIVFAIVFPVLYLFGQRAFLASILIASAVMPFIFAVWVSRGIESRFVLHGALVGLVAALIYIGLAWGQPQPLLRRSLTDSRS